MTMTALALQARRNLLSRRRSLLRLGAVADTAELPTQPDPVDRADERTVAAVRAQLAARELEELAEIEAALARLEAGQWGRCQTCGGPIGRQRLQALPEARECLGCRSESEKNDPSPRLAVR